MNDANSDDVRSGYKITMLGIFTLILAIAVMFMPTLTGISIVILIGILVTMGGVARLIWVFQDSGIQHRLLSFGIALLTIICGLWMLVHPLFATGLLSVLLGFYFVVDGIVEISTGYHLRPDSGRKWMLIAGTISIILGILIWMQLPLSGAWAIGILLGIKLLLISFIMLMVGSRAKMQ